jgi:hypothetical protein
MSRQLLAVAALALCAGAAQAATNVALGSTVTLSGSGFGDTGTWCCGAPSALAAASTVTDGLFLADGTQWNVNTVFWSGRIGSNEILITLPSLSAVTGIHLQADNNDDYGIRYLDNGGTWHDLAMISPDRSWGMTQGHASFAPVNALAFSITNANGDGFASVSEFQAIGAPVPEPQTYALLLAGLGTLGFLARRRSQA